MPKSETSLKPSRPAREPICPSLPAEIWINVLRFHTDLFHLWTACRRISSTLRACAEHAFGEYFLSDVYIDFQLEKYNLGGKSKRPEVPVTFSRLGKPKEGGRRIAWFKDKRDIDDIDIGLSGNRGATTNGGRERRNRGARKGESDFERVMQRWEENVQTSKPEMPNYTIRIGPLVNDTALPELDINAASREISFDWRRMFELFFREQERLNKLKEKWQSDTAKRIELNNIRLSKGEKVPPSDYPPPWPTVSVELRKVIRRARLKEHYHDNEEMLWAIESLRHFESHGAAGGSGKAFKLLPDLPGAGVGERWFGSVNLVQELYLDEWSCMHRIDTKVEHIRSGG